MWNTLQYRNAIVFWSMRVVCSTQCTRSSWISAVLPCCRLVMSFTVVDCAMSIQMNVQANNHELSVYIVEPQNSPGSLWSINVSTFVKENCLIFLSCCFSQLDSFSIPAFWTYWIFTLSPLVATCTVSHWYDRWASCLALDCMIISGNYLLPSALVSPLFWMCWSLIAQLVQTSFVRQYIVLQLIQSCFFLKLFWKIFCVPSLLRLIMLDLSGRFFRLIWFFN